MARNRMALNSTPVWPSHLTGDVVRLRNLAMVPGSRATRKLSVRPQIRHYFSVADHPEAIQPSVSKAVRYWAEWRKAESQTEVSVEPSDQSSQRLSGLFLQGSLPVQHHSDGGLRGLPPGRHCSEEPLGVSGHIPIAHVGR
jgi:hypothetical protein